MEVNKEVKASDYFKWAVVTAGCFPEIVCAKCGELAKDMTYHYDGAMDLDEVAYRGATVELAGAEWDNTNPRLVCVCGAIVPEGAFEARWDEDGYLGLIIRLGDPD